MINPKVHDNPEVDDNPEVHANPEVDDNPKGDDNVAVDDDWGESDEVEYVGVDDEKEKYKDVLIDDAEDSDYYPDTDPEDDDPLGVDDERGCEGVVHVTDIDNPKIVVGVTFEDGLYFKRCIRQYAVLNEVELAVPYSESRRYRAHCKAKRCRWRIHASQCEDGRTWQVLIQLLIELLIQCY